VNDNFLVSKRGWLIENEKVVVSWRIGWLLCYPDKTHAKKERMLACFIAKGCW
jgi:hypothetical protein